MADWVKNWGLRLALAALLLVCGCSGVLHESKYDDGHVERLKLDGGESWDAYDDKPRPNADVKIPKKLEPLEGLGIMLKKEATF
jgi:hypothetical protein